MKKVVSLVLALSLVMMTLTACGTANDANTNTAGTQTEGTAETAETTETTDGADADANVTFNGEIRIGGIGPVTGDAAVYGTAVKNGAQLAVDEINAAGGVNGAKLVLNFQDDEHDPEKAVNAYNTLKDWNMQLLMGTVTSKPCVAVAEESNNDQVYQLTPSGSAIACVQYDNAFRVCFSDPNQGIASAQYIGGNQLATKVAVIYDSSDVYSSGIYEKFATEAASQNFEIVAAEAFTSDSNKDFTVQLQKAKGAGADLVFLPIYYNETALILSQAAGMDYAPKFFGCDGLDGILTVENFDLALAEGVMLLTPFAADAEDEMTQNFVNAYQASFGDIPNQFAADAYDAIYIIKAAIEKGNVTPEMNATEMCELMKAAMVEISVDGLTGLGMTWTADGEVNKAPKAVIIENGVYKAM